MPSHSHPYTYREPLGAVGDNFYSNEIGFGFNNNTVMYNFGENFIGYYFNNNSIAHFFTRNHIDSYFNGNTIPQPGFKLNNVKYSNLSGIDFTYATHVYGEYNCDLFKNSSGTDRLSYYDSSDVLNIVHIDA
jgi:hypothetical protein